MFYSNLVILAAPVRLTKILRAYPPPSLEASDSAMQSAVGPFGIKGRARLPSPSVFNLSFLSFFFSHHLFIYIELINC